MEAGGTRGAGLTAEASGGPASCPLKALCIGVSAAMPGAPGSFPQCDPVLRAPRLSPLRRAAEGRVPGWAVGWQGRHTGVPKP